MSGSRSLAEQGRVRWGFIGCGDVTEVKSGPAFSRVAGSSISVVMRRDGAKAEDYAARHGVARWTTDAADVIEADDVDAVYVATPPSSHLEYVTMAAAAGKPVYVEKPMSRTYSEGEAMVETCERAGVPLFVAYYRRALPHFEFVRARLTDGSIGTPRMVRLDLRWQRPRGRNNAGWRWDPEIAGDGLLLDLGSHGLDLLDHWFGPIAEAQGFSATRLPWSEVTDEVVGSFRFAGGVLGSAAWSFADNVLRDEIRILGSEGSITVPLFEAGAVRIEDSLGQLTEHSFLQPKHVHEPLVSTMVDELLGRGEARCPSTGVSALRTQKVLDRLLAD